MTINKQILHLALPAIVTNITVPLLGWSIPPLRVTWAVQRVSVRCRWGHALQHDILEFRVLAYGHQRSDLAGLRAPRFYGNVWCAGPFPLFSVLFSVCIFLLQFPVVMLAFRFMGTTAEVEMYARQYFYICLLGLPPCWVCIASRDGSSVCRTPVFPCSSPSPSMWSTLSPVSSLCLCCICKCAGGPWYPCQPVCGAGYGVAAVVAFLQAPLALSPFSDCLKSAELRKFFTLNGGIFLRTFCLNAVMAFFTLRVPIRRGAAGGECVAVAAVQSVLILHRWFCLCWRGVGGQICGDARFAQSGAFHSSHFCVGAVWWLVSHCSMQWRPVPL